MRYLYYNPFFYKKWKIHRQVDSELEYLDASDGRLVKLINPDRMITETKLRDQSLLKNFKSDDSDGLFEDPIGFDLELILGKHDPESTANYKQMLNLPVLSEGDELVFFSMFHCFKNLYDSTWPLYLFEEKRLKIEFYSEQLHIDFMNKASECYRSTLQVSMIKKLNHFVNSYTRRKEEQLDFMRKRKRK